jgi:hypothetical protein
VLKLAILPKQLPMTDRQEDWMSMMQTLLVIRGHNAAEIAAIPDLDSDFDDLKTEITAIHTLSQTQLRRTTGVARDKKAVRMELVEMTTTVSGAVKAYASKAKNHTLFQEVKYTNSQLRDMRDEALAPTCRLVHQRANANLAALAGRGIDALLLADFMALINEFDGRSESTRVATVEKSTATAGIVTHLKSGLKIVKERLDGGMRIFTLSQPELYITYRHARKIVNTGHRKKKGVPIGDLSFHVKDAAGNPVDHVLVSTDNRTASTNSDGNGVIKGLSPGNKQVRFFKPGPGERFVNVVIENGKGADVNVIM